MNFVRFKIKRFRSLLDVDLKFSTNTPTIICGENNVGKTNVLKALNLFFNHIDNPDLFDARKDIPDHIYRGSRGSGNKTELTGTFSSDDADSEWKVIFKDDSAPTYCLNSKSNNSEEFKKCINNFRFLFIESNNVDIPTLISEIMNEDGLLSLDNQRSKQTRALDKLSEFIQLSQTALLDIENDLNACFESLTDFDSLEKDKQIKIKFAEFGKLRHALFGMTSVTFHDGNDQEVDSKGSGAQRSLLLALMQYISNNAKKQIIWGIDEPEVFLHPKLQRKVAKSFKKMMSDSGQPMIVTTHSQYFIDLQDFENVHLFKKTATKKTYTRRPNDVFWELNAKPQAFSSQSEKVLRIKDELGIQDNDGWSVLPKNVLVEGMTDKLYIESMVSVLGLTSPHIIECDGADKIINFLKYNDDKAQDLSFTPEFVCVFDNDPKGKNVYKSLKAMKFKNIKISPNKIPRYNSKAVASTVNWEMEDFIPPKLIFDAVNKILREKNYKPMTSTTLEKRGDEAFKDKQILEYLENNAAEKNSEKNPLALNDGGIKYKICKLVCESILDSKDCTSLLANQTNFLKSLF